MIFYSVAVSSQLINAPQATASSERSWQANLDLVTEIRDGVTRLTEARHKGPLRVQRPFVQNDGSCHIYLLHPPGGLVGGDSLNINIDAGPGTHTVLTTPAAGKHYGCLPDMQQQIVRQSISVGADALVEWVPQESIFFNRTNARVCQQVNLEESGGYLGWEIVTLGRRAFGEDFSGGNLSQSLEIRSGGRLAHREHLSVSELLQTSSWGLNGCSVLGTLIAFNVLETATDSRDVEKDTVLSLRASLRDPEWGVTMKGRTLLVRYLGDSAEACREGFFVVRDLLSGSERPRIWKT